MRFKAASSLSISTFSCVSYHGLGGTGSESASTKRQPAAAGIGPAAANHHSRDLNVNCYLTRTIRPAVVSAQIRDIDNYSH